MMTKIILAVGWFTIIYFGLCLLVGAAAGLVAGWGASDAGQSGAIAGAAAVQKFSLAIIGASALLSVAGTWKMVLPGTKQEKVDKH